MPSGRPSAGAFSCLWLVNDQLDQHWKPSKSRFVLTTSEDGIEVRCDPGFPDAWRKEPFRSEIRQWAISGETHDVTVVVIVGQKMILVTPDREFDLGVVQPDERIVRELEGTRGRRCDRGEGIRTRMTTMATASIRRLRLAGDAPFSSRDARLTRASTKRSRIWTMTPRCFLSRSAATGPRADRRRNLLKREGRHGVSPRR